MRVYIKPEPNTLIFSWNNGWRMLPLKGTQQTHTSDPRVMLRRIWQASLKDNRRSYSLISIGLRQRELEERDI